MTTSRACVLVLVAAVAAMAATAARAQSGATAAIGDPGQCVVVVENMTNVGMRIGDAQMVVEAVVAPLRKRLGHQAVFYEGIAAAQGKMNSILGSAIEKGTVTGDQVAYYKACMANAPFRIKATFGGKGKKHWIDVACKKKDGDGDADKKHVEGVTFVAARDALNEEMKGFCMQLPDISSIPMEPPPGTKPGDGPPGLKKKDPPKAWTAPPRRE